MNHQNFFTAGGACGHPEQQNNHVGDNLMVPVNDEIGASLRLDYGAAD